MQDADSRGRGRFDADRINAVVQTLAIIGAGAWAVYTFVYEARIKPGLEPPALAVTTALARAGERGDRVAIRSTVTRRNVGQAGVRVLGLAYTVIGFRVRFGEGEGHEEGDLPAPPAGGDSLTQARGYAVPAGSVILRQGRLFAGAAEGAEASDLNPGEAVSRDLIVYADRARYDFVRFEVSVAYAKADDPAVALDFRTDAAGRLSLAPRADCRAEPEMCARVKTTDFGTEFSLW